MFPSVPNSVIISGKKGSGKTFLLAELLTDDDIYGDQFNEIFICSPTIFKDSSYYSICKKFFYNEKEKKVDIPKRNYRLYWDQEWIVNTVLSTCEPLEGKQVLLICDDLGGTNVIKGHHNNLLDTIQMTHRHDNLSIWSIYQQLSTASSPTLSNSDMIITFYLQRELDKQYFVDNFGCGDKQKTRKMLEENTSKPYSFLIVNRKFIPKYYNSDFNLIYNASNS